MSYYFFGGRGHRVSGLFHPGLGSSNPYPQTVDLVVGMLPTGVRKPLAQVWRWLLITPTVLMVFALLLAIFSYTPGVQNIERVLNITLSSVGVSLGLLAFVAGFAYDIERSAEDETRKNPMKEATVSASILVAYATSSGSTQEVAEVVAATLREGGLAVDLYPMRDVRTLAGYSAVVLGAPLYMFRWHKDALRFLARCREGLRELPVAVFALGPFMMKRKRGVDNYFR